MESQGIPSSRTSPDTRMRAAAAACQRATNASDTCTTDMLACCTNPLLPRPTMLEATFHPLLTRSGDNSFPALPAAMASVDAPPALSSPSPTCPKYQIPFGPIHIARLSSPTFLYTARPLRMSAVFS